MKGLKELAKLNEDELIEILDTYDLPLAIKNEIEMLFQVMGMADLPSLYMNMGKKYGIKEVPIGDAVTYVNWLSDICGCFSIDTSFGFFDEYLYGWALIGSCDESTLPFIYQLEVDSIDEQTGEIINTWRYTHND